MPRWNVSINGSRDIVDAADLDEAIEEARTSLLFPYRIYDLSVCIWPVGTEFADADERYEGDLSLEFGWPAGSEAYYLDSDAVIDDSEEPPFPPTDFDCDGKEDRRQQITSRLVEIKSSRYFRHDASIFAEAFDYLFLCDELLEQYGIYLLCEAGADANRCRPFDQWCAAEWGINVRAARRAQAAREAPAPISAERHRILDASAARFIRKHRITVHESRFAHAHQALDDARADVCWIGSPTAWYRFTEPAPTRLEWDEPQHHRLRNAWKRIKAQRHRLQKGQRLP